ncbi:Uncharacterized protein TCM_027019 [Theobroma cacao]|uniref:Uncharacterized protein n=1 Tax=Theobroma cacao TaxID=3641 RepID=A0A061G931_THECC|nr:Uncharacterized protein TCM_027019 [Theobroma cacao]
MLGMEGMCTYLRRQLFFSARLVQPKLASSTRIGDIINFSIAFITTRLLFLIIMKEQVVFMKERFDIHLKERKNFR